MLNNKKQCRNSSQRIASPAVQQRPICAKIDLISKKFLSIIYLSIPPALELGAASLQLALKNKHNIPWPSWPLMWSRMAGQGTCYTFHITVTVVMTPPYGRGPTWATTAFDGRVPLKIDITRWGRGRLSSSVLNWTPITPASLLSGGHGAR